MFKGKRGVSPLIATVLLIAFAVALGAVIMQFGEAAVGVCGTSIQFNPVACLSSDGTNIKFTVANKGSDEIASLKVDAKGASSSNHKDFAFKIPPKGNREGALPYAANIFGELKGVTFTPVIDTTACSENAVHVSTVGTC